MGFLRVFIRLTLAFSTLKTLIVEEKTSLEGLNLTETYKTTGVLSESYRYQKFGSGSHLDASKKCKEKRMDFFFVKPGADLKRIFDEIGTNGVWVNIAKSASTLQLMDGSGFIPYAVLNRLEAIDTTGISNPALVTPTAHVVLNRKEQRFEYSIEPDTEIKDILCMEEVRFPKNEVGTRKISEFKDRIKNRLQNFEHEVVEKEKETNAVYQAIPTVTSDSKRFMVTDPENTGNTPDKFKSLDVQTTFEELVDQIKREKPKISEKLSKIETEADLSFIFMDYYNWERLVWKAIDLINRPVSYPFFLLSQDITPSVGSDSVLMSQSVKIPNSEIRVHYFAKNLTKREAKPSDPIQPPPVTVAPATTTTPAPPSSTDPDVIVKPTTTSPPETTTEKIRIPANWQEFFASEQWKQTLKGLDRARFFSFSLYDAFFTGFFFADLAYRIVSFFKERFERKNRGYSGRVAKMHESNPNEEEMMSLGKLLAPTAPNNVESAPHNNQLVPIRRAPPIPRQRQYNPTYEQERERERRNYYKEFERNRAHSRKQMKPIPKIYSTRTYTAAALPTVYFTSLDAVPAYLVNSDLSLTDN